MGGGWNCATKNSLPWLPLAKENDGGGVCGDGGGGAGGCGGLSSDATHVTLQSGMPVGQSTVISADW